MKQWALWLLALMLLLFCGCSPSAELPVYPTAGDLYHAWHEVYPDYLSGVWSTDGGGRNLTFGVQNDAGKQAILDQIEDDSTASFVYQPYSRNRLAAVLEELLPYFKQELGLVGGGIYDNENCVHLEILRSSADLPATKALTEELRSRYGDMLSIWYVDEGYKFHGVYDIAHIVLYSSPAIPKEGTVLWPLACAAVSAVVLLLLLLRQRRVRMLLTNTGHTVAASPSLQQQIRDSHIPLPPHLDSKIFSAIDK